MLLFGLCVFTVAERERERENGRARRVFPSFICFDESSHKFRAFRGILFLWALEMERNFLGLLTVKEENTDVTVDSGVVLYPF